MPDSELLKQAAVALSTADALLIGAGAGMGVDSGLPDFRGSEGFWQAYPPYAKLGLSFAQLANPHWFEVDPGLAWGFYGHRLNLYRRTTPHHGFQILLDWSRHMGKGAFVFTSNVDGHFQRAGFADEAVCEVHGSIHWMQCLADCGLGLIPAADLCIDVDETTFRASDPLPACPKCGGLLRPNILMFGDGGWDSTRTHPQETRLDRWLEQLGAARVVVVECGAGTTIPTVRGLCEQVARRRDGLLIRLNCREPQVPTGHVGLTLPALDGLRQLDALVSKA